MNVAICIISTGEYNKFLTELIRTINLFFLKDYKKTIFLYTDNQFSSEGVSVIRIDHLPPPLNSLLKFKYLSDQTDELKKFDLIYYIDCDCLIVNHITDEIFPDFKDQIVAVKHPWQSYKSKIYETNKLSTACVVDNKDRHYYQACFFGSYSETFLNMSCKIKDNVNLDLKRCFIAKWYDESHFNKFLIDTSTKELGLEYAYPNPIYWNQSFGVVPKIIHHNKTSVIE